MRSLKTWLIGTFILASLAGGSLILGTPATQAFQGARETLRGDQSYWRHHDGHWSHWDARDKRWYYTDGKHWYYHNGKTWRPYRFDKTFGRDNFERGQYAHPRDDETIVVPRHGVYEHVR